VDEGMIRSAGSGREEEEMKKLICLSVVACVLGVLASGALADHKVKIKSEYYTPYGKVKVKQYVYPGYAGYPYYPPPAYAPPAYPPPYYAPSPYAPPVTYYDPYAYPQYYGPSPYGVPYKVEYK
jgi:hypothetical protein